MILTLLVAMFLGSYAIGFIPILMPMSEKNLNLVSTLGAGLLVGTALTVNIPEGVRSLDYLSYSRIQTAATYGTNVAAQTETTKISEAHSLIGISLLLGFVFMLLVDHCLKSGESSETHKAATVGLVIHAAVDGIVLGAAATTGQANVEITIFITIMLHKAPEAFGLVTFLLREGLESKRIIRQLTVFALSAPVMTTLTYIGLGEEGKEMLSSMSAAGIAMLFGAGTFLYVATVHVLPELTCSSGRTPGSVLEKKGLHNKELVCLIFGTLLPLLLTLGNHP